jgi:pimeloyl-ACP methyl ester carboxylesterase
MQFEPFEIHVSESMLEDLKKRIAQTRWTDSIADSGWNYGTEPNALRNLMDYWQDKFVWRKTESWINSFPQFRITLEGLGIHFVHLRSKNPAAVPLIITHGWPGSFLEQLKFVPLLQDYFHVVIPSLPGYGFSDASRLPGMNPRKIAALWVQLMQSLGYDRFISQGGDWGATVSTWLGLDAPESLIGIHLNYIPGSYRPYIENQESLTDREKEFLRSQDEWMQKEGAYAQIQATKPQTLAYAMNDSPVGLAAWILEKSHGWSHCEGSVFDHFTYEELLNNTMLYWITESFGSSIRLYYEARKAPLQFKHGQRVTTPTAVARFAKEEPMPPREWVERGFNVRRWTEYPVGSHFAALEVPEILARDIIDSATIYQDLPYAKSSAL